MNYHQQLTKGIDFIGQHLDEELSLESLSDYFYISKFHSHLELMPLHLKYSK